MDDLRNYQMDHDRWLKKEFLTQKTTRDSIDDAILGGWIAALVYGIVHGLLDLIGAPVWAKNLVAFGLIGLGISTVLDDQRDSWIKALINAGRVQKNEVTYRNPGEW